MRHLFSLGNIPKHNPLYEKHNYLKLSLISGETPQMTVIMKLFDFVPLHILGPKVFLICLDGSYSRRTTNCFSERVPEGKGLYLV